MHDTAFTVVYIVFCILCMEVRFRFDEHKDARKYYFTATIIIFVLLLRTYCLRGFQLGKGKLPSTYTLANVESREGQQALRLRMYLEKEPGKGVTIENDTPAKVLTSLSGPKTAWWILKVFLLALVYA